MPGVAVGAHRPPNRPPTPPTRHLHTHPPSNQPCASRGSRQESGRSAAELEPHGAEGDGRRRCASRDRSGIARAARAPSR